MARSRQSRTAARRQSGPGLRPDGSPDRITGGARPDITFQAPNKRFLFINTGDRKGFDPTNREYNSGLRIVANSTSGDLLLIVPKLREGEDLDWNALHKVVSSLLDRLCSDSMSASDRMAIFRGVLQPKP